jgi:lipopolysaccharide transport system ATP-binding protein
MANIWLSNADVLFPRHNDGPIWMRRRKASIDKNTRPTIQAENATGGALTDVTLSISPGEKVGVVGRNGAGKSTLLRVLSRIYVPTSGEAVIEGTVSALLNITLGFNLEFSGRENIYLRGAILGLSKSATSEMVRSVVEFAELGEFIDRPMSTYSSGMSLRLAFAISTACKTDILIMDEWLSVGDEQFKEKARRRVQQLVDRSEILVVASHSQTLLETVCSRVIWLEQGRIKQDGLPHKVLGEYFKSR